MLINKLRVANFRNFKDNLFQFSPKITVIVGPNASGKTNLLESLYLLSTGKSFRARIEEEMVSYSKELARVKALVTDGKEGEQKFKLEIILTRGEISIGGSPNRYEKVARKKLLLNGVGKRLIDFAGNFRTVLFGPWDLDLVTESPSLRRKFLDSVLSQVDRDYRRVILSYEKGLRQRNKLLFRIREEGISRGQLLFWDKLLIKNGDLISDRREELIDFITEFMKTTGFQSGNKLNSDMSSSFEDRKDVINEKSDFNEQHFSLIYDKSAISEGRLDDYAEEEVAAATTLVGPHRDDMIFKITNSSPSQRLSRAGSKSHITRNLATYGSRGEQRMAVLWLKLAELVFIESKMGEKPTLLLDDIFSELDHEHRDVVMEIAKGQQTIITTADPHFVEHLDFGTKIEL